ncbi:MAG: hypothetical protein ACHBNF_14575 [Chromatiales bacterium]
MIFYALVLYLFVTKQADAAYVSAAWGLRCASGASQRSPVHGQTRWRGWHASANVLNELLAAGASRDAKFESLLAEVPKGLA